MGLWEDSEGEAIIGVFKGGIDVSDALMNRSVSVCVCLSNVCSSAAALQSISASGPFATPLYPPSVFGVGHTTVYPL